MAASEPHLETRSAETGQKSVGSLRVVAAWFFLAAVDGVVKTRGFYTLHRLVGRCPRPWNAADPLASSRTWCAAVERARTHYPKHAWCLQSAAAAVCLLRLSGVPSELVIGVRKIPFLAHAWVEVEGRIVLNELSEMRTLYREMSRW